LEIIGSINTIAKSLESHDIISSKRLVSSMAPLSSLLTLPIERSPVLHIIKAFLDLADNGFIHVLIPYTSIQGPDQPVTLVQFVDLNRRRKKALVSLQKRCGWLVTSEISRSWKFIRISTRNEHRLGYGVAINTNRIISINIT
jgi:hypothetical protein